MRTLSLVIVCLLSLSSLYGQDLGEHQQIAKYLDSETILTGWLDISKVDADEVVEFFSSLNGAGPSSEEVMRIRALQDALVRLNVNRIYWIGDLSALAGGLESIVVPSDNPQAVSLILTALGGPANYQFVEDGDVTLGGSQRLIDALQDRNGEPTEQLLSGIRSCDGPHGIAVATPAYVMMTAMGFLKSMIDDENVGELASTAEAMSTIKWLTLSGDLPPSKVRLSIKTDSPEAANQLSSFWKNYTNKRLKEKSVALAADVDGASVVLASTSEQQSAQMLKAFQELGAYQGPSGAVNAMQQIGLALHNYHDSHHQHLPAQSLVDADGRRLLSWRVLILPYLGHGALYKQFHLDEPWDSPHNLKLAEAMPPVYRSAESQQVGPGKTRILAPMTKDSVFGRPGAPLQFRNIVDGLSNTIWFVQAAPEHAVVWTKPEDLLVDGADPVGSIVSGKSKGFWAGFVDGAVMFLSRENAADTINAMITFDGKDKIEDVLR